MAKNKQQSIENTYRDFSREQLLDVIAELREKVSHLESKNNDLVFEISDLHDQIDDLENLYIESHEQ